MIHESRHVEDNPHVAFKIVLFVQLQLKIALHIPMHIAA